MTAPAETVRAFSHRGSAGAGSTAAHAQKTLESNGAPFGTHHNNKAIELFIKHIETVSKQPTHTLSVAEPIPGPLEEVI